MAHKIALNFEDGITRFIDVNESESIADAAYRQGINVPLDCTNGVLRHLQMPRRNRRSTTAVITSRMRCPMMRQRRATRWFARCGRRRTSLLRLPRRRVVCKTRGQTYRTRLHSVDRLSETTIAFSLERSDAFTFPPRSIRERRGAGHRPTAVLFLQLTARRGHPELRGAQTFRPG